jgi:hypothetical protein
VKRRLTPVIALLLLAAAAVACGGSGDTANGDPDGETASPVVTLIATEGPLTTFEALRDDLLARLDAIGVNIGIVPDDIGEQLVSSCLALEAFVESERVAEICASIGDAIERGDPGLIDLVMERLADLEPD